MTVLNINVNKAGGTLSEVYDEVLSMEKVHTDESITSRNYDKKFVLVESYSTTGLNSLGKLADFPTKYVLKQHKRNPSLATRMLHSDLEALVVDRGVELVARSWNGIIEGVVSPTYKFCDDAEVFAPIVANDELNGLTVVRSAIAPMYTSVQLRSNEEFYVPGDDSPLYWGVSISNSMTGFASVTMRLFVWRLVYSNGLAIPKSEEKLLHCVHRGSKDIAAEINKSVIALAEKQRAVQRKLIAAAQTPATILQMNAEGQVNYLISKLNLGEKDANAIINLFNTTYGGESRWGMAQAIAEFARDRSNTMVRDALERRALEVA